MERNDAALWVVLRIFLTFFLGIRNKSCVIIKNNNKTSKWGQAEAVHKHQRLKKKKKINTTQSLNKLWYERFWICIHFPRNWLLPSWTSKILWFFFNHNAHKIGRTEHYSIKSSLSYSDCTCRYHPINPQANLPGITHAILNRVNTFHNFIKNSQWRNTWSAISPSNNKPGEIAWNGLLFCGISWVLKFAQC